MFMLKKGLSLLTLLLLFASTSFAQDITLNPSIEYEIGGISVVGADNLDPTVIQLLSGLTVGDKIRIPGQEVTNAVKKLWEQQLFADVSIAVVQKNASVIFLEIRLVELPRLSRFYFIGIKKSKQDDLREALKLTRGTIITENLIITSQNKIEKIYREKGYLNATSQISVEIDSGTVGTATLRIEVNPGERVKIEDIHFFGNENFKDSDLRGEMEETKRYAWFNFFRSSKFIRTEYEADLRTIIDFYNQNGYRDARVVGDSIYQVSPDRVQIDVTIEEGPKYYFRNISFIGNSKYSTDLLRRVLEIEKGDIYDSQRLNERVQFDPDGNDIASIYLDNGYLFSSVTPVEVLVENDSIDIEIRIREGRPATVNEVRIVGNDRTNDHVIYRELRTRPGDLFSRSDIQRTIRELAQLGYFDPRSINVTPQPNPETGTVDLEYTVVEQSTSQLELQGGWGAGQIVGTLGLRFNNFSARNLFKGSEWKPLPSGDGQTINLRAQASGRFFQSYSASFTEPWLFGKRPQSFTASVYHNINQGFQVGSYRIAITGVNMGLGRRLTWPDDYFTLYTGVEYRVFNATNYTLLPDGVSRNINLQLTLRRDNRDVPIFPTRGSSFSLTAELTPPFSLWDKSWPNKPVSEQYEWIEYHKWKFSADWYTEIAKNTVFRGYAEFGFLGSYNDAYGLSPFERFFVGGDGLQNFAIDGREIIGLRGYPNLSLSSQAGDPLFNKFTFEMRYLISPNPQATIYVLGFLEAGDSFSNFEDFRPFNLKRSAGGGVRIFMPMFGLLGVDLGYGFDPIRDIGQPSGWQTHFVIGQQF
ncbi:MAG: outer membrane protein assembly factor BamA [Flavobacteriia bacterium]|nr:outer membrane protein assembly factor BamA [Flavobacteriia bacterium]